MRTLTHTLVLILGFSLAKAQTLDSVLNLVKAQNKTLKVYQSETEANVMAFRTGLNPENPTAEYEILFGTPKDAGNQQDFAITQRFDFPSSYTYRKQAAGGKIKQADFIAKAKGQELLLNVKLDWLQWVYLNQLNLSYTERVKDVEKLHAAYQKKMSAGDGNVLDLNKVKLLLLETKTQLKRNEQQREHLKQKFVAYTGGSMVTVDAKAYPANPRVPSFEILDSLIEAGDPLLKIYVAQQTIAAKETAMNKALTLPGFEAGYHSQSILGQKYQGIHLGLSIPLWERKNTVKQKRLEQLVAENRVIDHRLEHVQKNRVYYQQYEEATYLLGEYKALLDQLKSEPLLDKALQFGEISVIQYYNEILSLYKTRDAYLEYALQQQQAVSRLFKFTLE
ncbi:TolC family protein [Pedobacter psychroterrae]|uniref:TolC family protein n=1 Tax=Pedobacter psychroterrae TaxID=2530453 RepID=A0A4R0NLQ7_9SPHI|nr:TolC family protein [Pedobacter psychroterrae]TCD01119.1 TolC family protein [Pedobacter psychroterrae]